MNYIYQLSIVERGKHQLEETFALPTWKAFKIEQEVFERFSKYRIQYYEGIEPAPVIKIMGLVLLRHRIIKVGISTNPNARLRAINNDPRSGYTEYLEITPWAYLLLVAYIFRRWFFWTIFVPALAIAILVISIIIFTL